MADGRHTFLPQNARLLNDHSISSRCTSRWCMVDVGPRLNRLPMRSGCSHRITVHL